MNDFHVIVLHHQVAYIMGYVVWISAFRTCTKYIHPFCGNKYGNSSEQSSITLLEGILSIADLL